MIKNTDYMFLAAAGILFCYTIFFISTTFSIISHRDMGEITGMATNTSEGLVNFTISSEVSLNLILKSVDFGAGYVGQGCNNCSIDTEGGYNGDACCVDFNKDQKGLVIENTGNQNIRVNANFSKNASEFIGGDDTINEFRMLVVQNATGHEDSGSCVTIGTTWATAYADVPIYDEGNEAAGEICDILTPQQYNDSIRIHINITIPDNAPAGLKTANVTVVGTGI